MCAMLLGRMESAAWLQGSPVPSTAPTTAKRKKETKRAALWLVNVIFVVKKGCALPLALLKEHLVPAAQQFCILNVKKAILKDTLNNTQ